jgi:hypothetical protein
MMRNNPSLSDEKKQCCAQRFPSSAFLTFNKQMNCLPDETVKILLKVTPFASPSLRSLSWCARRSWKFWVRASLLPFMLLLFIWFYICDCHSSQRYTMNWIMMTDNCTDVIFEWLTLEITHLGLDEVQFEPDKCVFLQSWF